MATQEVVDSLNEELEELQALQEEIAATGQAVDAQNLEVQSVLNEVRQAKLRAESEKLALESKNDKVTAAAAAYFQAIQSVRDAVGSSGELAATVRDARVEAVRTALSLPDAQAVQNLRHPVQAFDAVLQTARQNVETTHNALRTAQSQYDSAKADMERTAQAILGLADKAELMAEDAKGDLEQLNEALSRGESYRFQAVVHLEDLLRRCEDHLEGALAMDTDPPGFGATLDSAALLSAVNGAWTTARTNYEGAADALWGDQGAEVAWVAARNALAEAEAGWATRLTDAARSVEEDFTTGQPEGGG